MLLPQRHDGGKGSEIGVKRESLVTGSLLCLLLIIDKASEYVFLK
jgi:hypothetical protein